MSERDTAGNEIRQLPLCCDQQNTAGDCPIHNPRMYSARRTLAEKAKDPVTAFEIRFPYDGQKLYTQSDLDTLLAKLECGHLKAEWVPPGFGLDNISASHIAQRAVDTGYCIACLRESQLLAKLVQVVVERAATHQRTTFKCSCGHRWTSTGPSSREQWSEHIRQLSSPENIAAMIKEAKGEK